MSSGRQVLRCKHCLAVIMGFKYPMMKTDRCFSEAIDQTVGQKPWFKGDQMRCKQCGVAFTMEDLKDD